MKHEKLLFRMYMCVYICFKNAVIFWEIFVRINVCLSVYHLSFKFQWIFKTNITG